MTSPSAASILYVDDEATSRFVFAESFGKRFPVRTAASGAEALELMSAEPVAVLVTDQRMPDMPGHELLRIVKDRFPEVVRIAITGYSDLDPILRAVNDGLVARYLVKPWNSTELESVLAWAVEAFEVGRESSELHQRILQTERLVTLGSVASTIIHDLNQPLSYLTTNSERLGQLSGAVPGLRELVKRHGTELPPTQHKQLAELAEELPDMVRDMLEGCRLMLSLTAGIRRLTRPASVVEPRVCDPLPVVRYAASACRHIALTARATVAYEGPSELPRVAMGSTELTQVLISVVANAAQAVGRREKPGGRVRIDAAVEGAQLAIRVLDDGPGMTPEVLERVGTPFFSTRTDGAGLGIAVSKRLVERAEGTFEIASTAGEGTVVTVRLPKA
jgi:signal transduction histidine kinase